MFNWLSKLSRNNNKTKITILVFVLLLLGAWATDLRADTVIPIEGIDDDAVQFEVGSAIVRGQAPTISASIQWKDAAPGDADFECGLFVIGESTYKEQNQPNQAGVQCMLVDGFWKFDIGLGVAMLQNTDRYNGSNGNFSLMLRYNVTDKIYINVRHFSNFGTVSPNLGRDLLLVGYRF